VLLLIFNPQYAVPVDAEALAVQMETHIEFLPSLEMMHWCLRFGQGQYKNLPLELVRMIVPYVVKPVRERAAQELAVASRCFKNECSVLDHADRQTLLQTYKVYMRGIDPEHREVYSLQNPTDADLKRAFEKMEDFSKYIDEKVGHHKNRVAWLRRMEEAFDPDHRAMFQRQFGLDIWYSFVSRRPGPGTWPQATIAYLILPGSVKRQHSWSKYEYGHDIHGKRFKTASVGGNGFGMPVEMRSPPSAKQLDQFPRAMKYLNLKVFVHKSQKQYPALSTPASDPDAPENSKDA